MLTGEDQCLLDAWEYKRMVHLLLAYSRLMFGYSRRALTLNSWFAIILR